MGEATSTFTVVMPRLGLTMTEAIITEWLKPEGAWVEKGDGLFVLEHEKASLEIESPASGRLHILASVGQVVPILAPIASLEESGQAAGDKAVNPTPLESVQFPSQPITYSTSMDQTGTTSSGPLRASPKARALARKHRISLQGVVGNGPRGMIVASDIQGMIRKVSPLAQKVAKELGVELSTLNGSGLRGQVTRQDVQKAALQVAHPEPTPDIASLKGLRGIIARRLAASWVERPQVTLTCEADATELVVLRKELEADWNLKVSFEAILTKLVAQALREHPYINTRLTAQGIQFLPEIHIGLAVASERGLVVPVLHHAGRKSLFTIQQELQEVLERAIAGTSNPDELSGGTFTITNLGMYEIEAFTPLINPPECAILGVGRIASKPVGLDGHIVLREMVWLSLSFDHRLVDGAPAARFLQRIKSLIEHSSDMDLEHGY